MSLPNNSEGYVGSVLTAVLKLCEECVDGCVEGCAGSVRTAVLIIMLGVC